MSGHVSPEALVPLDRPLRPIRVLLNHALERLSGGFGRLHAAGGRDSVAPEKPPRALLLRACRSPRSERRLIEQATCNMRFRRFAGLSMDAAAIRDVAVSGKGRDRLPRGEVAGKFLAAVPADPEVKPPPSSAHFPADGAPIEARASMQGFRPKAWFRRGSGRDAPRRAARAGAGRMELHAARRRLRSGPIAEAAGGGRMIAAG